VEAIAVTQAIERSIAVVKDHDPTLDDGTLERRTSLPNGDSIASPGSRWALEPAVAPYRGWRRSPSAVAVRCGGAVTSTSSAAGSVAPIARVDHESMVDSRLTTHVRPGVELSACRVIIDGKI
jgi:hypothetical protein